MAYKSKTDPALQALQTENTSTVYSIKRNILTHFQDFTKDFQSNMHHKGYRRFMNKLMDKEIPKAYREAAKAPVDEKKVVFVEVRHPQVTNSMQVMFDELANNYDYNIHTHFLLTNGTIRADFRKRCLDAVKDIATAKYVFMNEASNTMSAMPLRPETKIIQLWHGCGAFKKFGFSTADLLFGASREEQLKHPFNKNYSLVTVSSPEVIWAYNEAMNIDESTGIVQATGSSRTDIFYNKEFLKEAREHVYELVPQAKDKKIILYAPTFRGRVAKAETPDMLNIKMFYEALGDEYVLLIKHHPVVKNPPAVPEAYKDFAMDVGNILSIEELLSTADICISDYSSLVFEYSLFEKPLIFFAYDLDEYFDWRGFYYDYFELAPGLIAKTNFEMIDYIKHIDERFDKKAIQDFRYKFMRSCDGHATQRIIDTVFENPEAHKKECKHFEHFYTVPKVESSKTPYFKRVEKVKKQKKNATKLYDNLKNSELQKGSVIALDIKSKEVRTLTKAQGVKLVKSGNLEEAMPVIAQSEYIIIDKPSTLLDSLEMRDETKVIYLPPNAFPLTTFGCDTKKYRSGLRREIYEVAPLFNSVSAVTAPSEATGELFKKEFGKDVKVLNIGDVKTDIFFDEKNKNKILDKLYEAHPKLKGRKIIVYISTNGEAIDDSAMYEYLYKNYVLLKCYTNLNNVTETLVYYADSIVDVSDIFKPYELLSIADIAIGNINAPVLSFAATGKPLFLYTKNTNKALFEAETLVDVKEDIKLPIYNSIDDVIKEILDIENYDYSGYNQIKDKYLANCNGKSLENLLNKLK